MAHKEGEFKSKVVVEMMGKWGRVSEWHYTEEFSYYIGFVHDNIIPHLFVHVTRGKNKTKTKEI